MDWSLRLISLYVYICNHYNKHLGYFSPRQSNNWNPNFTDAEVICIFLFGVIEKRREVSEIYKFTHDHLADWFPNLPTYEGYIQRLNRLSEVFVSLLAHIQEDFPKNSIMPDVWLMDSMPIVIASAKRSHNAKVAKGFANKGYCSSKGTYYYGIKLHVLGLKRLFTLPMPSFIGITPASNHDLDAFRHIAPVLKNGKLFVDKAYQDQLLKNSIKTEQDVDLMACVKKAKGQKVDDARDCLLSTAISRVRQPIESLFNWLEEKTGIQRASKVRSYNGLCVHVFGRMAAALYIMAFNP